MGSLRTRNRRKMRMKKVMKTKMKMMLWIRLMKCLTISFGTRIWRIWNRKRMKTGKIMTRKSRKRSTWETGNWTSRINSTSRRKSSRLVTTTSRTRVEMVTKMS